MSDKDHRNKKWPYLLALIFTVAVTVTVSFLVDGAVIPIAAFLGTGIVSGFIALMVINQRAKKGKYVKPVSKK